MKIGIIGAGKVGISIAHMLQGKGFLVTAVSDTQAAARETAERYLGRGPLYTENNLDVVDRADAVAVQPRTGLSARLPHRLLPPKSISMIN